MTRDIATVMVTVDRTPQQNYLADTLRNLFRGGLVPEEGPANLLHIVDSKDGAWPLEVLREVTGQQVLDRITTGGELVASLRVTGHTDGTVCANQNVATALRAGASQERSWVLFLEDDIDVCADFFDSVGKWLDKHATSEILVYALGCAYPAVAHQVGRGATAWLYDIKQFFGTQCFAIRSVDALSLADYLEEHCYDKNPAGTCYDLLMHDWAFERDAKATHFLASCPSFVQHMGKSSVINPREKVHEFPSWPGRDWSYA